MCIVHALSQMQRRLASSQIVCELLKEEGGSVEWVAGAGAACLRAARIIFAAQGLRNTAAVLGGGARL